MTKHSEITLSYAKTERDYVDVHALIQAYSRELPPDIDISEDIKKEYATPNGVVLLARFADEPAGCCALRPLLDKTNYANACEMRRLFVASRFRRQNIGRQLVKTIIELATLKGYSVLFLDALNEMEAARSLYEDFGFTETEPFYHGVYAGSTCLMIELDSSKLTLF